ncbi:Uncharacterised protein [Burkholderia pseudomallei]|nr:Uncharacterised protein [Burkholderia pseudomallei]
MRGGPDAPATRGASDGHAVCAMPALGASHALSAHASVAAKLANEPAASMLDSYDRLVDGLGVAPRLARYRHRCGWPPSSPQTSAAIERSRPSSSWPESAYAVRSLTQ